MIKDAHDGRAKNQLTVIGRVKVGRKGAKTRSRQGNEYQPPERLDHLLVTTLERDVDGNYVPNADVQAALEAKYGKPLKQFKAILPLADISEIFDDSFSARDRSGTEVCKGDGETAMYRGDVPPERIGLARTTDGPSGGGPVKVTCNGKRCPLFGSKVKGLPTCKFWWRLRFHIPEADRALGVYEINSTSEVGRANLRGAIERIAAYTGNHMYQVPALIGMREMDTQHKSRVPVIWADLEGDPQAVIMQTVEVHKRLAAARDELAALPGLSPLALAPAAPESDRDVAEEFYPDVVEAEVVEEPAEDNGFTELRAKVAAEFNGDTDAATDAIKQAWAKATTNGDLPEMSKGAGARLTPKQVATLAVYVAGEIGR